LGLLGLAIVLFASTNVDDLFVLLGFFAEPKIRARDVVVGQFLGISMIFGLSVAGSLLTLVIPRAYVGLLGSVPILLGMRRLLSRLRAQQTSGRFGIRSSIQAPGPTTVAIITLANGSDNIGVYVPSFAIHSDREIAVFALTFAFMTGIWCLFAHGMVHHPYVGEPIRRYAPCVTPLLLMGIGIFVIVEAHSFQILIQALR
jgi:cadmium resistance protein CadD (predicted permease)